MGARTKLNGAALNGALLIAVLIAFGTGDILAGALVGGIVVAIGLSCLIQVSSFSARWN